MIYFKKQYGNAAIKMYLSTILSAIAFACSSFLDLDGAPAVFGFESFRVTVRLNTKEGEEGREGETVSVDAAGGNVLSLSTTKNPNRSNCEEVCSEEMREKGKVR
jgi:hypothetical protein